MDKNVRLAEIAAEINHFQGLEIARKCTRAVPGEGNPDTEIMFIGEAPGFNEDLQGRPFVGQAGKLLEKTLSEVLNLQRSDVYITNIVKFRPPENRDPLPDEIAACKNWLDEQISIISPKVIVTLGRYSLGKFFPDISISQAHGQLRYADHEGKRLLIFPMYHPAAALRSGAMMSAFVADFNKLKNFLSISTGQISSPVIENKPALTQQQLF